MSHFFNFQLFSLFVRLTSVYYTFPTVYNTVCWQQYFSQCLQSKTLVFCKKYRFLTPPWWPFSKKAEFWRVCVPKWYVFQRPMFMPYIKKIKFFWKIYFWKNKGGRWKTGKNFWWQKFLADGVAGGSENWQIENCDHFSPPT